MAQKNPPNVHSLFLFRDIYDSTVKFTVEPYAYVTKKEASSRFL